MKKVKFEIVVPNTEVTELGCAVVVRIHDQKHLLSVTDALDLANEIKNKLGVKVIKCVDLGRFDIKTGTFQEINNED